MTALERAIIASVEAHTSQLDRAGQPYILHPLRVMAQMKTETERIVALLHDVAEDSKSWHLSRITENFGSDVSDAVDALTKRPLEEYHAYLARVEANPIACKVKLADLADNSDMERLSTITEEDWARHNKYQSAIARLAKSLQ